MHQLCSGVLGVSGYILTPLCLRAKPIYISFSMHIQKNAFCLELFFFPRDSNSVWTGSIEKSMDFVIDIELYHVYHHHQFCI